MYVATGEWLSVSRSMAATLKYLKRATVLIAFFLFPFSKIYSYSSFLCIYFLFYSHQGTKLERGMDRLHMPRDSARTGSFAHQQSHSPRYKRPERAAHRQRRSQIRYSPGHMVPSSLFFTYIHVYIL